jgi:hypothetical protein
MGWPREKTSVTVNRCLAFAGALAVAQPAVALGAPTGGLAHPRPAPPTVHPVAWGEPANQDDVKVPFHVNIQPQIEPQHFTFHAATFHPQTLVRPHRLNDWQFAPGYFWYPALYGPACSTSNSFLNASSEQLPADLSIGSLVDGKSNILSPQSYNAGYAAGSGGNASSSSPFAFQVGFYPQACGAPSFTSL